MQRDLEVSSGSKERTLDYSKEPAIRESHAHCELRPWPVEYQHSYQVP